MVTLGSRHDITLDAYRRVAWEGDSVAIAAEAIEQMAEANRAFLALIDSSPDLSVYMVTTGGETQVPSSCQVAACKELAASAYIFFEPLNAG